MIKCLTIPDRIGIWKCWFLRRGENRSTRRKTSRSKEENQQQTQPTYDAGSGNRTRDTLVGGERSHHCDIPAPLMKYKTKIKYKAKIKQEYTLLQRHFLIQYCLQELIMLFTQGDLTGAQMLEHGVSMYVEAIA